MTTILLVYKVYSSFSLHNAFLFHPTYRLQSDFVNGLYRTTEKNHLFHVLLQGPIKQFQFPGGLYLR